MRVEAGETAMSQWFDLPGSKVSLSLELCFCHLPFVHHIVTGNKGTLLLIILLISISSPIFLPISPSTQSYALFHKSLAVLPQVLVQTHYWAFSCVPSTLFNLKVAINNSVEMKTWKGMNTQNAIISYTLVTVFFLENDVMKNMITPFSIHFVTHFPPQLRFTILLSLHSFSSSNPCSNTF